jgi:hypothetical protein
VAELLKFPTFGPAATGAANARARSPAIGTVMNLRITSPFARHPRNSSVAAPG